ncbi:MAG: hypothetical protein HYU34_03885 [Candidatus Omnitrophica bacterium]|nr:hypothetical protein [Candidatus Omnitrophota bacterium]
MEYFAYSQKEFVYKYVVMLSDTDQFKHMSFANYLKLMFLATDAILQGFTDVTFLSQKRIRLAHSRMKFKRQSVAGDSILVKVNSSNLGKNSFTLLYTFLTEGSADLVALGRQAFECVGLVGKTSEEIPQPMRSLLDPIAVKEEHLLYSY